MILLFRVFLSHSHFAFRISLPFQQWPEPSESLVGHDDGMPQWPGPDASTRRQLYRHEHPFGAGVLSRQPLRLDEDQVHSENSPVSHERSNPHMLVTAPSMDAEQGLPSAPWKSSFDSTHPSGPRAAYSRDSGAHSPERTGNGWEHNNLLQPSSSLTSARECWNPNFDGSSSFDMPTDQARGRFPLRRQSHSLDLPFSSGESFLDSGHRSSSFEEEDPVDHVQLAQLITNLLMPEVF